MRTAISELHVQRPAKLSEALEAMRSAAAHGEPLTPLAGGTDIFVYLNAGALREREFLNLWPLKELRGIRTGREGLRIGALETFTHIRRSPEVRRRYPALAAAAGVIGGWQIQNRGTIAGNIANGSPAGDSLPALLALDARIRLVDSSGFTEVPFEDFYTGYRATVRQPDQLIESVLLPPAPGLRQHFRKVGTRLAQAISKVVLATAFRMERGRVAHARIALGSVAPTVVRARAAEALLAGQKLTPAVVQAACARLQDEIHPIDDIRSDARHRRELSSRLLALALSEL